MSFTKDRKQELLSLMSSLPNPIPPPRPIRTLTTIASKRNEQVLEDISRALRALDKTVLDIEEKVKNKSLISSTTSPSLSSIPNLLSTYTTLLKTTTQLTLNLTNPNGGGTKMERRHWETVGDCVKGEICAPSGTSMKSSILPVFGIPSSTGSTIGSRFDLAVKIRESVIKEQ
eukprot:CAMPEP_0118655182 /NCGR_PEP_ID=MMETSP0785-20121206/12785_1 /TAXON_ID=91992 /ORGANISM="Bolidomonas pacifica, Strain CCMP 1866" /LENGTH=172 /DNA_ID=CAMNT_0006547889 /DNA_START=77 /DNA_END=592 /DNA_ORIENTATION=+